MIQMGGDAFAKDPNYTYTPEYVAEWTQRMRASFNADDYLAVMAKVYAAHFSADELNELTLAQEAMNKGKPPQVPDSLKAKLVAQNLDIQSEILGGCSQVGAKVGGRIGQEIQARHPGWVAPKKPAANPVAAP